MPTRFKNLNLVNKQSQFEKCLDFGDAYLSTKLTTTLTHCNTISCLIDGPHRGAGFMYQIYFKLKIKLDTV